MTTYVPALIMIASKKQNHTLFSKRQAPSRERNIISNQIRSYIRRVHGTKHQETTILTIGPNQRKRPKNIQKQITAKFQKKVISI